jgi:hypothetical protein
MEYVTPFIPFATTILSKLIDRKVGVEYKTDPAILQQVESLNQQLNDQKVSKEEYTKKMSELKEKYDQDLEILKKS